MLNPLQRLDSPARVNRQKPMEAGFGDPTQPLNACIRHSLAAQIEGFQSHLDTGVGMMESPLAQGRNFRVGKGNLNHLLRCSEIRSPDKPRSKS
jgi:hypothetical protein